MPSSPVLRAEHVGLALNGVEILAALSFALRPGEWTFLYGPPGAGKTMLLRLAAGAVAPTEGRVERAGPAALVTHDAALDDAMTARAIVAEAARETAGAAAHAEALLAALGLEAYLNHEPFRLSRGHRTRLAIAQALAARPALLCLDDPFSPMDRSARARTAQVLRRAADETGLAILMVSNEPADALRHADRALLLTPGPAARIAHDATHAPRADATDDEIAADPLFGRIEAALWSE